AGAKPARIANDMRQDHLSGGIAVVQARGGIASRAVEEPMDLALRMVKAASAPPTIGAAVNCRIAVLPADAVDFPGGKVEGLVPGHFHEGLDSTQARIRPAGPRQKALAHGGPCDPAWRAGAVDHLAAEGGWIRIALDRRKRHPGAAVR